MKSTFIAGQMESHHEFFHLGFGLLSLIIVNLIVPGGNLMLMLLLAILASFLPDFDHLLFIFIYGKRSTYATAIKKYLSSGKLKEAIHFCKTNHKSNNFILSHNLLVPAVSLVLSGYFLATLHRSLGVFFLSWAMHYIFDILEDFIALGRINPNWYFRFSRG